MRRFSPDIQGLLFFLFIFQMVEVMGQADPGISRSPGDACTPAGLIVNGLSVNLPPQGELEVKACQFNPGGCDVIGGFKYSFSSDPADSVMILTCADDWDQLTVDIWITDVAGNATQAETYLWVLDYMNYCDTPSSDCSPVIQLEELPVLSYSGTGVATVSARDFDRGTYLTNCSPGMGFSFSFSSMSSCSFSRAFLIISH